MPEGPEVRRAADRIARAVANDKLCEVVITVPTAGGLVDDLLDHTLDRVDTHGKAFSLVFSNDVAIYVHLQLYGVWRTGLKSKGRVKTNRSLRILLETETHYAALYSATDIEFFDVQTIAKHPYIKKLGVDVLNRPSLNAGHVSRHIGKSIFQGRRLGQLLLDQSFVAGIGNYLRSEILFEARLHPQVKMKALTAQQKTSLARSIHLMLNRAYQTGGITASDEIVNRAKARGLKRSQYRHFVFSREGECCDVCESIIIKTVVAGRRLYLCPQCQVEPC